MTLSPKLRVAYNFVVTAILLYVAIISLGSALGELAKDFGTGFDSATPFAIGMLVMSVLFFMLAVGIHVHRQTQLLKLSVVTFWICVALPMFAAWVLLIIKSALRGSINFGAYLTLGGIMALALAFFLVPLLLVHGSHKFASTR